MKKSHLLGAVCAIFLSTGYVVSANATLLSSNEILQVEFSLAPPTGSVDMLSIRTESFYDAESPVTVIEPVGLPSIHKLYDENVLIGSYSQTTSSSQFVSKYASPSSVFTFQNPTIVDLSSFANGTDNGLLEIQLTSGLLDIDLSDLSLMQMTFGRGASGSSFTPAGRATVTNMQIISAVPIPASVWLFGSGLLGLIGVARRKKAA